MAENSKIEYIDDSLNPIRARLKGGPDLPVGRHCERVSAGCANCYAEAMNIRFGTGLEFKPGNRDKIEIYLDEKVLFKPVKQARPRIIFLDSTTDLFGSFVPTHWIDKHFAMASLAKRHTLLILTKRVERALSYLQDAYNAVERERWAKAGPLPALERSWPLQNVLVGCTVENQEEADKRREYLKAVSDLGWRTYVSYEPALGPVDWNGWEFTNWIISGGESRQKARPSHPGWYRATRDFCAMNDIPYFHKQNGEWVSVSEVEGPGEHYHFPDGATVRRTGKKRAGCAIDGKEWKQFPTREHAV